MAVVRFLQDIGRILIIKPRILPTHQRVAREIHDLLAVFQQNVIRPAVFLHGIIQKGFPRHLAETGERIVVDLLGDDIRIDLHLLLVAADGLVQVVLPGLVQHAASENPHGNEKHHCRQKGNFLP